MVAKLRRAGATSYSPSLTPTPLLPTTMTRSRRTGRRPAGTDGSGAKHRFLALAADDDDASASSAPPKLQRSITAADATKGGTANWRKPRGRPRASYRRLWEAATGSHENMSLGRMREKAEQITKELALLNAKIDRMQTQKEALLMAAPQAPQ